MKYKILFFCLFSFISIFAGEPSYDKVTGSFMALGVGPRLPVGTFSNTSSFGFGGNVEFSYTDNEILPVFVFAKIGYDQYAGSADFYQGSDYSHFSTKMLPINVGLRYYFPPIFEQFEYILPAIEVSAAYAVSQELNEFKIGTGRNNFISTKNKFGFSIGASISMFIVELSGNYNFFYGNQTLSIDLKTRLPIAVTF